MCASAAHRVSHLAADIVARRQFASRTSGSRVQAYVRLLRQNQDAPIEMLAHVIKLQRFFTRRGSWNVKAGYGRRREDTT